MQRRGVGYPLDLKLQVLWRTVCQYFESRRSEKGAHRNAPPPPSTLKNGPSTGRRPAPPTSSAAPRISLICMRKEPCGHFATCQYPPFGRGLETATPGADARSRASGRVRSSAPPAPRARKGPALSSATTARRSSTHPAVRSSGPVTIAGHGDGAHPLTTLFF